MTAVASPPPPLTGVSLAIAAFALALGTFMQVLDMTITNVALPTIAGNLGVSADTGTWVITSFAVANGISVPLTGWLMMRYGVVRTFVLSVGLFTFASFLCGVAWSLDSLVAFRVLQGAVSGPMIPGSQALLISIFPANRRAAALGIWSMTTLIAPVLGPVVGGLISDNVHWSWLFLMNLPVGLLVTIVCLRVLRDRETPTRRLPIDRVGLALLVIWVGALQIMLDRGKTLDWFASDLILAFAIVAAVGFVAWLIWELTDAHPTVDLSLFAQRNFLFGTIAFSLGFAVFFSATVVQPLWMQTQLGYTATWAGLVLAPSGVVAVVLTPLMARLTARIDVRWLATLAFTAFGLSFGLRSGYTNQLGYWELMLPVLVQGIAMSCFFLSMTTISLDGIPPERVPAATGVSNFCRITCGSFGASLAITLWDRREAVHQSAFADVATPDSAAFAVVRERLLQLGFNELQSAALILRQAVREAYLLASVEIFYLAFVTPFLLMLLVWFTKRPTSGISGPPAAD